jgi:molybdopterin-guanine dinucleotide biosynthesis protein A
VDLPLIEIVLLAGGEGRRLGGLPKPLLRGPDGRTLLERALWAYRAYGVAWVVAPQVLHPPLRAVSPSFRLLDDPGEGPAVALQVVWPALSAEWIWVAAADHPDPEVRLVERLRLAAAGHAGAQVLRQGIAQPMPGIYRRTAWAGPARSLRALFAPLDLAQIDEAELTPSERASLEDVDLPTDVSRHGLLRPG